MRRSRDYIYSQKIVLTVSTMQIQKKISFCFLMVCIAFVAITGCEGRIDVRGSKPDPKFVREIMPGIHKKSDVQRRLGTPSTVAMFDNEVWYYINGRIKTVSFFEPTLLERKILIIRFNKNGVVKKIEYKDTTEQKPAEFVQRKTPTKGKELNALQQIFGNIGKFKPPKTD